MHQDSRRPRGTLTRMLAAGALTLLAMFLLQGTALADGGFVIGDGNAAIGESVTFWGAQWHKDNTLSGGPAPASFKGFADNAGSPPACGETWTTRPGNSSAPPEGPLPELIEVIVSSEIAKSGSTISGNAKEVVLVATEPGYGPDPGHAGTGTVLAVVCGGSGGFKT